MNPFYMVLGISLAVVVLLYWRSKRRAPKKTPASTSTPKQQHDGFDDVIPGGHFIHFWRKK